MPEENIQSQKLVAEHEIAGKKLDELKRNGVALLGADFDGTVFDRTDPRYNLQQVIQLAYDVTSKKADFALISARNTTLELTLRQEVVQFCRKRNTSFSLWRSGGNGMNLSKVTSSPEGVKVEPIYSHYLTLEDAQKSLEAYRSLHIDPDVPSQKFFQTFLQQDIPEDLVPKNFLALAKPYDGLVFGEAVKISFVLPTAIKDQETCIESLRKSLEPHGLVVGWARMPFADISKQSVVDGKLFAIQRVMEQLGVDGSHVGTFGDATNDSDKGFVCLPYGFTYHQEVEKTDINSPPFILDVKDSPVGTVHQAIQFLIQ